MSDSKDLVVPAAAESRSLAANRSVLSGDVLESLHKQGDEFLEAILQMTPGSPEFKDRMKAVTLAGDVELRSSVAMASRLLQRPVRLMEQKDVERAGGVPHNLTELRRAMESLDPSKQSGLLDGKTLSLMIPSMQNPGRLALLAAAGAGGAAMLLFHPVFCVFMAGAGSLAFLKYGRKIEAYFQSYQAAERHLIKIQEALNNGKRQLEQDNASIEIDRGGMKKVRDTIDQFIELLAYVDNKLADRLTVIERSNPERAAVLRNELHFYVRRRHQSLMLQQATNIQGSLTFDLAHRTNEELINNTNNALTITMSALKNAVSAALVLGGQKLVLTQNAGLSEGTGELIENVSIMLKDQSSQIYAQAGRPEISIQRLSNAFNNVYSAIDNAQNACSSALGMMEGNITELRTLLDGSQKYLDQMDARFVRTDSESRNDRGTPADPIEHLT